MESFTYVHAQSIDQAGQQRCATAMHAENQNDDLPGTSAEWVLVV